MSDRYFTYDGISLGLVVEKNKTNFRLWALNATDVILNIYEDWQDYRRKTYKMIKNENKIWSIEIPENLQGKYYTYTLQNYGTSHEIVDPYAVASSPNSQKGYIVDLKNTNPEGWEKSIPIEHDLMDTIIYETHVRDLTVKWDEDEDLKGTFNGVTSDLLSKIKDLGISHIQWMPVFDFATVDELGEGYNWGYDPVLFNVVEGSYASDVMDPTVRIRELKEMIMRCHQAGIRVVMDVVYNHTYKSKDSNLNRVGPNYFYRMNGINNFSNGSGCGNELNTEGKFVRKFIIDSLLYWQKEYKIDGFRFDLMGLYDLETVDCIQKALKEVDPQVLLYGEPWTAGGSALGYEKQFKKGSITDGSVGYFNDDFRNTVKGDNDTDKRAYIGGITNTPMLLNCLLGSYYDEVKHVGHAKFPWESINYLTSHDNLNLYDKISRSFPNENYETKKKICGLCFSILLTSVGIPFIQGGAEMMASKQGHHNTYNMGDDVNAYDWSLADLNQDLRIYIKRLTMFRKNTFLYQLTDFEAIKSSCKTEIDERGVIVVKITDKSKNEEITIFHNGCEVNQLEALEDGEYEVICGGMCYKEKHSKSYVESVVELPAYQTVILKKSKK